MKQHSEDFKNQVAELGRQFSSKLIYGNTELVEELYSVTPHFKGNMLKSTMKQLDVETTEDIPIGTEVNYQLGLLVDDEYEWLDYGNYIVYSSEKQEDKGTYKLVCYDKLLNSMKEYEGIEGTFPMTLREYLQAICDKLDIDFGSANDDFANYNIEIPEDRYTGLQEYTYRDVLDEIAQATGSMICLNSDDELIVKYINEGIDNYNTVEGTSFELDDASGGLGSSITKLEGNTTQDGTPTPTNPIPIYTVSGDNEVLVRGKNLFDNSLIQIGKAWNNSSTTARAIVIIPVNPSTQYTLSFNSISGLEGVYCFGRANENDSTRTFGNLDITGTRTITTTADTNYIGIQFNKTSITTTDITNCLFQIEKGTTATTYEPYNGNSYRVDFGGDNLLPQDKYIASTTTNGITYTNNGDGTFSLSGTASANTTIRIIPVGDLSLKNSQAYYLYSSQAYNSTTFNMSIVLNDSGTNRYLTANGTLTTPSSFTQARLQFYIASGNTVNVQNIELMLVEGNTAPSRYSPYVSNPIELCKIGNYVDKLKRAEGKQLFNYTSQTDDGWYSDIPNFINDTGTYTISINNKSLTGNWAVYFINSSKQRVGEWIKASSSVSTPSTFTVTTEQANAPYIRILPNASGLHDIENYNIMVNEGSTALPYEPYGNNWYIEKNIGKVVLNGSDSEYWTKRTDITGLTNTSCFRSSYNDSVNANAMQNTPQLLDRFVCLNNTTDTEHARYTGASNYRFQIFINKSRLSSDDTTGFKNWLAENNVTVYYIKATPTYETITNENLIQQLNNIQDIDLIENLCYVDWVGEEKPTMTLKYYQGRTLEEINEEYLKDVNVDFGEKYGPVNSIVLSRSGESDNVYIQDEDSIEENGLHELKIVDNQLMNFNDRSDYLQDLLDKLDGLEYYINDFKSTGICYLELGDRYYVHIGDNTYSCVMFNDEIDITTGLEELIYTEMPEETETDYTKADKTDRRINQTYIIVDKQNQEIQSLVSDIGDRSQKTTTITQDIDGIEEILASTVDVTRDDESYNATVSIAEVNLSEPVEIRVKPTTSPGISYLYPRSNLYPSDTMYPSERKIRFVRTYVEDNITKTQNIDYELPDDLLYYSQSAYDEFVLDYLNKECKIIKKCAYNANGQVVLTGSTETIQYEYPTITLPEGDYEVKILGYNVGYIYARLMIQNEYTKLFTTEVETETSIAIKEREIMANVSQEYETKGEAATQYAQIQVTTDGIQSEVANKVGNDEVVSKINQSAEAVSIDANKININGVISANGNFKVDTQGNMTCNNAKMNGGNVALYGGTVSNPNLVIYDDANNTEGGRALFTSSRLRMYPKYSKDDHIEMKMQFVDNNNYGAQPYAGFDLYHGTDQAILSLTNNGGASVSMSATGSAGQVVNNGPMYATAYNNYSKESIKKNFEKINNATDILKNAEIYEYNYKNEKDSDRKHIGFVIADEGGNFKTPKEVMSKDEDAIDMYSMCSILWKAVQEQQEKIEKLENKLKEDK